MEITMGKKLRYLGLVTVFSAIFISGCATVQVAQDAKGTGKKRVFDKPESMVWPAMQTAITATGGQIISQDQDTCSILARYGASLFSWGERVAIFCTPLSESKTETEVVSKRAISVNITASDWTHKVYGILERELR